MFENSIARYLEKHGHSNIQLKAVLFDMDGVLFNSMPYHADAWHKVMKRHGLHLSREEAYMHEGRTGASTINIVYQRQYGKDATPEMIESIYAEKSAEFSTHPEPERMPGAWEVLQKVKAAGLIPVLVTGSGQHSLLNRLAHNFPGMFQRDHMVTAFDVKYGKPHPEPYLMGLEKEPVLDLDDVSLFVNIRDKSLHRHLMIIFIRLIVELHHRMDRLFLQRTEPVRIMLF